MAEARDTGGTAVSLECAVCTRRFSYIKYGPGRFRRMCSAECGARRKLHYRPPVRYRRDCARCGEAFTASKPSALYCGRTCKKAASEKRKRATGWRKPSGSRPWEDRPCRQCAERFAVRKDNDRAFCGDACKQAWARSGTQARQVRRAGLLKEVRSLRSIRRGMTGRLARCEALKARRERAATPCEQCGLPVGGRATRQGGSGTRFCSTACYRLSDSFRDAKRISRATRKARQRGAQVEPVNPIKVFERDGWRCHLCGGKTIKSKRGTYHPKAPELDHIVPIGRGGEHSYRNTACAHRACNHAKSDSIVGQPSLLAA